jgi:flagellar basal-body rod modification protein FlgD
MSTVSSNSGISASTLSTLNTPSSNPTAAAATQKDEFMKLLVAQLQHQDPLQPTDNTAFVAQLAQFSQLEQAATTNQKLTDLADAQASTTRAGMAQMVGKTVTARTSTVNSDGTTAPNIQLHLDGAASKVDVTLYDLNGNKVKSLSVGATAAGDVNVDWAKAGGGTLAAGQYRVEVKATGTNGTAVSATPQLRGVIQSLTFENGTSQFNVGGNAVSPSDIISIGS